MTQVILQLTGKRKQALLESILPGISCSTGMVKESVGKHQPLFLWIIPRVRCLKKLNQKKQRKLRCFILLLGLIFRGAYILIYEETENEIIILTIWDSRQDPEKLERILS